MAKNANKLTKSDVVDLIVVMLNDPKLDTICFTDGRTSDRTDKYMGMHIPDSRKKIKDHNLETICKKVIKGTIKNSVKNTTFENPEIKKKKEILNILKEQMTQ